MLFDSPRVLFALAAAVAGLGGCAPAQTSAPTVPNVVLISVDTLRPDRLGCYGATTIETPAIDALARDGVRFEHAFTPVPLTLPAHWTLHTGVEPWHHGIVDNGMTRADDSRSDWGTLAERFTAAGYDTAAFVAAFVLHRTFGLDRGFAFYDDGPADDAALDQLIHATAPADERVGRALHWLTTRSREKAQGRPFFLWLHLFDPHAPYHPPADFRARYGERPYDGEVAFVDTQIARLLAGLKRLGVSENTDVVLTSDHGESLGEHGEETHGVLLYDATLRVPLIFRRPHGDDRGRVRNDTASLADVAPTVLTLAGLTPPPGLDGRDLFASNGIGPRRLGAISESPRRRLGWASQVSLRDAEWKFIASPNPELYQWREDPHEEHDQFGAEQRRAADLARGAKAIENTMEKQLAARSASEPSAAERAQLAALGYVSGSGSASDSAASRPDPKKVISSLGELDRAYQRFSEGKLDEAEASFRALLSRADVPAASALEGLARIARLRGENQEAEAAYLRLLEVDPESLSALAQLILLARERNDSASAVRRAQRLAALAPRDAGANRLLAEALAAAGQPEAAEKRWRQGLEMAPRAGWLRLSFARFLKAERREEEAQGELDRLLASDGLSDALQREAQELRSSLESR